MRAVSWTATEVEFLTAFGTMTRPGWVPFVELIFAAAIVVLAFRTKLTAWPCNCTRKLMTPSAKYGMAEDTIPVDSGTIWSACWIRAGALSGVEVAGGGRKGWAIEDGVTEGEVDERPVKELALSAGQTQVMVELSNDAMVSFP